MKKKSVNLVTAVAVLVVLSGAYIGVKTYVTKQEEKENESEEEKTTMVFSSDSKDIQSLTFLIDKKEVTFEKDDDNWIKSDDPEFPVNQDILTEAAGYLNEMEAQRVLEDVEDNSEYGLDNPENTITITTSDDEKTSILVGMENESTSQYYVEKEGEESTVYVVSNTTIDPFMKTLYDYAQQETFPTIDSTTVTKVQVEGQSSSYSLTEDQDTQLWDVEDSDGTENADTTKANSVVTAITGLAYDSFVDYNCEELSKYGLDKPYAKITIDYTEEVEVETTDETDSEDAEENADEETTDESSEESTETKTETVDKELVILVGDEAENNGRYVMVNDSNEVYTIANESLSAITEKVRSDFWDLTVNYLPTSNLDSLEVEYKGEKHVINVSRETSEVENDDEEDEDSSETETTTTTSYEMDGEELDDTLFSTFYNKMTNLVGQKRLEEEFNTDVDPDLAVKFTDLDGNVTDVEYYTYDTNFYAAVTGEKVYLINKMNVKEMLEAFEEMI